MRLIARDNFARHLIECPTDCEVRQDEGGTDFLVLADSDDPAVPYWLFDEILIEAARSGEFGLRMLAELPLN